MFPHLMWTADSLEKSLMLRKTEDRRRRGRQRMRRLAGMTDAMGMSLGTLRELVRVRRPGLLQSMGSQRAGHDWANEQLLSLLVGVVLTVSAALSRLGILSGYGRMAVLENNEEDERMICDERRVWKNYCVLSLGWARILLITHQYLFKHLIPLLLFVGGMCCLLLHLWWPHLPPLGEG